METIDLHLDEQNELVFEVMIEAPEGVQDKPLYRFVCETGGIELGFRGEPISSKEVKFILPVLSGRLKEGQYPSRLEVIVENKLFVPMQMTSSFRMPTKVVAESVRVKSERHGAVQATAKVVRVGTTQGQQKGSVKSAPKTQQKRSESSATKTLREQYEKSKSR